MGAVLLDSLVSELDCRACVERGQTVQRGCYIACHRREKPLPYLSSEHPLFGKVYHCPKSMSMAVSGWSQDWALWSKGIIPADGGWDDQQALYCEAMLTIHDADAKLQAMRLAEMKEKTGAK